MAKETVSEVTITRKVKVVTPKGKYTNHIYQYAIPVSSGTRLPLTGQQKVITWREERVPRANGGEDLVWVPDKDLSKLSASDKKELQMGDSPFIINPANFITVRHGYAYNDDYKSFIKKGEEGQPDEEIGRVYQNPRDHAELLALLANPEGPVAPSKSTYNKNKHNFYIDDKEKEAQETLNEIDLSYEAERFVREDMGTGRWKEILIFLGHAVPDLRSNPDVMTDTQVKAVVLDACRKYPKEVLKMKGPGAARIIFVTKVLSNGIVARKKNNDFYYGDIYIGPTFDSVAEWMDDRKNSSVVTKWQHQLDFKERQAVEA